MALPTAESMDWWSEQLAKALRSTDVFDGGRRYETLTFPTARSFTLPTETEGYSYRSIFGPDAVFDAKEGWEGL